MDMNDLFQAIVCAKRLKYLRKYTLLPQVWRREIQEAAQLAESISPIKPKYLFDGGFHKGWFSHTLSIIFPQIEICACDPMDFQDQWLITSSISIIFFNVALSSAEGSKELLLVNDSQLHSLLPLNSKYQNSFGSEYKAIDKSEVVHVSTIDSLLEKMDWPHCDLLKLDIQGSELDALKGARKHIKNVKAIYLEVSFEQIYQGQPIFEDINSFLESQGFKLSKILNCRGKNYLLQADALYLNTIFYPPC